ncbi:Protein of unknown function [Cotesia congregata]|uniref:Uncharacterized protein n=1 Tax=Cotesia congregata TaxID=51543 RepID=A0A8J2HCH8_COTCN|nr:Protein of unknown function [Cotesia congregata]
MYLGVNGKKKKHGDLFGGLNSGLQDGLLSRAEALAADLGKHNAGTPMPLKHDPVSLGYL